MFCSNCGRQLQEGEICECQKNNSTNIGITQTPAPVQQTNQAPTIGPFSHTPSVDFNQNDQPGYNQYNASGQIPNNNQYHGGNPYVNNQTPPAYYQQPSYMSEDEKLKRYMATPKFVTARDFMCSLPVLLYAVSITALLLYNFIVMQSFLHPFLILLVIASWLVYCEGVKSKKNNSNPSITGLSIGSGVAITWLVIWCIVWGLLILLLTFGVFGVLSSGNIGGTEYMKVGFIGVVILLVIAILVLVLGIKYYSIQSRNLKGIRYCITNEADPKRFSSFPSVILFIAVIFTLISIISTANILSSTKIINYLKDMFLEYFSQSGIDKFSPGLSETLTNQIMDTLFSKSSLIKTMIAGGLEIFNLLSLAIIYISAKAKLKDFCEIG